ncbi:hypothetical protein B566_EDAN017612 [Ephemera danica]|nr:hypothetical protein B566_EDAN017612 [Ephemera danica]
MTRQGIAPAKQGLAPDALMRGFDDGSQRAGCLLPVSLQGIASAKAPSTSRAEMFTGRRHLQTFGHPGSDSSQEGIFIWTSTGQTVTFTDWHTGQPDDENGVEDAINLWYYNGVLKWNDWAFYAMPALATRYVLGKFKSEPRSSFVSMDTYATQLLLNDKPHPFIIAMYKQRHPEFADLEKRLKSF